MTAAPTNGKGQRTGAGRTVSGGTTSTNWTYDTRGRTATASTTTRNYTGQRLDGTGLLYYNARYYDPALGRFISPDSIVPGAASGAGGAADTLGPDSRQALRPLTVDFHEGGFLAGISQENAFTQQHGFWFELSSSDRGKAKLPWGPSDPQSLNRYSYTLNNPVRYIDPTGHTLYLSYQQAENFAAILDRTAAYFEEKANLLDNLPADLITAGLAELTVFLSGVSGTGFAVAAGIGLTKWEATELARFVRAMAQQVRNYNCAAGVAIGWSSNQPFNLLAVGATMYFLDRENGAVGTLDIPWWVFSALGGGLGPLQLGNIAGGKSTYDTGYYFTVDASREAGNYSYYDDHYWGAPAVHRPGCE